MDSSPLNIKPFVSTLLIIVLSLQLLIVEIFSEMSLLILSAIFALLLFVIYFSTLPNRSLSIFLLLCGILSFGYLNDGITYSLLHTFLLDLPIIIFYLWFILNASLNQNLFKFEKITFEFPLIILGIYSLILAFIGFTNDYPSEIIYSELYHFFYYLGFFPIFYFVNKRQQYKLLFNSLIIVSLIICIQYIILNINSSIRFNSFQNAFLPFPFGILLTFLFFKPKNRKEKLIAILGLLIIISGSILIRTRILWICLFISIIVVTYLYLSFISINKKPTKKNLLILLFIIIPIFFTISFSGDNQKSNVPIGAEERLKSISNPAEDLSFLMRVEISYYAFQRFLENPIYGEGFGNRIKFKVFESNSVLFIDNSLLYFLWKGGIILLMIMIWVFKTAFSNALFVLKNTSERYTQIIMIAIISSLISFIFYGMFSANLIAYKMTFFYSLIFAYVAFERQKIEIRK